ncbi:unnamed protein product [Gulo gulo]|uniref:Uncharacterized protein n=1 Tax=Gulo gulo TaxID=48420 RepID=A0A9X9Q5Y0_GULGU|nr:unnamed protein product [Gulo gulo]
MMPVRKQPCVGQRTGFKAFVAIGDHNRYLGVTHAVRLGEQGQHCPTHGGNKVDKAHAVPYKVTCCYGSVLVDLILAPRGVVSAPVTKKLPTMASSDNCYTPAGGCMAALGNLAEVIFMPFPRPTAISPLTSGKRLCAPSLPIRNSQTIL